MVTMKIEVVRMHLIDSDSPVKAYCDLQFGDDFVMKGFTVKQGKDGLYIGLPFEEGKNGKWFNTFMPLSDEFKTAIENAIIEAYDTK